jgi:EmrB/QacA subfamily drug resistance transporter
VKFLTTYNGTLRKIFRRPTDRSTGHHDHALKKADYVLLFGLMLPLMMTIVNMTMFDIALPTIRDTFGTEADLTAWLVTAYSLPFMLFMPLYGRLGDELGKRRLFFTGIGLFLLGSLLIPLSTDLRLLFLGRIIQGVGAAGISPLSMALITQYFPVKMRGKALGTWNSIGPISGIMGPFLAGVIIDSVGWRVMFVPIGVIGILSFSTIQRQIAPSHTNISHAGVLRRFDWGGFLLLSVAITLLMFYISSRPITGVDALQDWRLFLGALLVFTGFLYWEKQQKNPFIHLNIFRNPHFCLASLGSGIRMAIMGNLGFLMPLYLTDVHALHATLIGIITTLNAVALLLTIRLGGLLADRWNNRWPVMLGASTQLGVVIYFACLPATAPPIFVGVGLAIHGLGAGLALASLHRTSLRTTPPEHVGMAAGLYSMIRFGVSALGVALAGVILQYGLSQFPSAIQAYQFVFWCIAAFALLGIIIAWHLKE